MASVACPECGHQVEIKLKPMPLTSRIRRRLPAFVLASLLALVGWVVISKTGSPGIRRSIYAEQMTADLFRFRRAQTAYFAEHNTYAGLHQLKTFSSTPGVEIQIEYQDDEMVDAIARHWDTELSCRMSNLEDPLCLRYSDVERGTGITITSSEDFR